MKKLILCLISIVVLVNSCINLEEKFRKAPPVAPVQDILKTSSALSYAVGAAMSVISGQSSQTFRSSINSINVPGTVLMHLSPEVPPFPPGIHINDDIIVAGILSDTNSGILSVIFTNTSKVFGQFNLMSIMTVPVVRRDNVITIVFAGEDINSGNDTTLAVSLNEGQVSAEFKRYEMRPEIDTSVTLEQDAWIIEVDNGGTPGDIADDVTYVTGAGQNVTFGTITPDLDLIQIISIKTELNYHCVRNPVNGFVLLRNYGLYSNPENIQLGSILFDFHPSCDGKCNIPVATGSYILNSGRSINLGL